jgi:hypothetical protein
MALYAGHPPPSFYASGSDNPRYVELDSVGLQDNSRRLCWELALSTLRRVKEHHPENIANPDDDTQVNALAKSLGRHVPELRAFVGMDGPPPANEDEARALDPKTGILLWDAKLANYLAGLGQVGEGRAEATRAEAPDPNQTGWWDMERPAERLWSNWCRIGDRAPPVALQRLAWVLWFDVVAPVLRKARPKATAISLPAAQVILSLRYRGAARTWEEGGQSLVQIEEGVHGLDGGPVRLAVAPRAIPREVATRLISGDLRALRTKAAVAVLDLILRALEDDLSQTPFDGRRLPQIEIPTGKELAAACHLAPNTRNAAAAEAALHGWSTVSVEDYRGNQQRFLFQPERRAHGGGRKAAWLVVPGGLLLPTELAAEAAQEARAGRLPTRQRPWRRIFPWPDIAAPDKWAGDRARGDATFLTLGLGLEWTEAAGKNHGRSWLKTPGVLLDDAGWGRLVDRAHAGRLANRRGPALDALEEAGWIEIEGELVAPGPALPRMARVLNEAAESALQATKPKSRRRK